MLNIYTAVCLETLADNMIEKIKEAWKNPFEAPVVIFPDSKVAQWFKFRWVEKYGSIANLNIKRLETFLFEILKDENDNYKQLTSSLLRNIIIAYLKKNIDVKKESIFSKIKNYLQDDGEEVINEARLFDFSDTLAKIFIEYETTRPADFIKTGDDSGIIDYWLKNENYFNKNDLESEKYQKKNYYDIFSEDGCLKDIIAKLNKYESILGSYITLPQLFRKKFKKNDIFPNNSDLKLFLFGFASFGQFYRNAIKYLSLNNAIYLYLVNPFTDCSNEEIKNDLLANWGSIGKTNLNLLTEGLEKSKKRIIALKSNKVKGNSDLALLQRSIIENRESLPNNDSNDSENSNNSLIIQSTQTKLREVEILHSNISKLLLEKKAQIKDILVAIPDLDSYRSAIYQVFNQSAQKAEEEKNSNKTVLHIPFTFVDSSDNESLTYLALKRLFNLKEKGYLSRPDFFELVRNPVVQAARGIELDEISNWEGWISSMYIYRDKSDEKNWLFGVKRLLLAKLSNKEISIISPFSDIGSSDNDSLCRFIDSVCDLENWIDKYNNELKNMEEVNEAFSMIEKWLLMQKVPSGLGGENHIFQKLIKSKDELIWQFAEGIKNISYKIFAKTLLNSAMESKYNTGNLFVNGITFMKFVPNRIIPTKYLFLLGIDSNRFPRKDYVNSLDLREKAENVVGDEFPSEKDKYALLCYLLNISEAIFISYVNKDLQKDEDFYPSSVIIDICQLLKEKYPNIKDWKELVKPFSNSENRDWKDLFTQSALRNKETYEMMMGKGNKEKTPSVSLPLASSPTVRGGASGDDKNDVSSKDSNNKTYPERVTVYQLRSFLEEPFKARIERNISSEEEDSEKDEFEPIDINKLDESRIRNQLVLYGLNHLTCFDDDHKKEKLNAIFDNIEKEINIEFPKDKFGNIIKNNLIDIANNYINNICSNYNYGYIFRTLELSVDLKNEIKKGKTIAWNLNGTANIIAESDDEVHIIELVSSIYPKHYINPYLLSLAYIAKNGYSKIYIDIIPQKTSEKNPIEIILCENKENYKNKAIEYLNNIYIKAFANNSKVLPIDLLKKEYDSINDFINDFENDYGPKPWRFFAEKDLFDIKEVSGFNKNEFHDEWNTAKTEHLKLFPEVLVNIFMAKK